MVEKGIIDRKSIELVKSLLTVPDELSTSGEYELISRKEFQKISKEYLQAKRTPYRTTFVGPMFVHPDWFFELRRRYRGGVSYDRSLYEFLSSVPDENISKVRIICRNNIRYKQIVGELVPTGSLPNFKEEVINRIDTIWSRTRESYPLLCCVDTGFLNIPVIHPDISFVTWRRTETTPISQALMYRDKEVIARHESVFDEIFDSNFKGIPDEIKQLKNYVMSL